MHIPSAHIILEGREPSLLHTYKDFSQRLNFASLQGTHHMEERSEFMNLRYFMPLRFCFWMPKLVSSIVKLLYLWMFCLDYYSKVFINFYAWFSSCYSMFLFGKPSLANEYYAIEIEHKRVSWLGRCSNCLEKFNVDYILNPMINDHLEGTF